MNLNNAQRQYLRRTAHSLRPLTQIGKAGLTNSVINAIDQALEAHELIKVKFLDFREEKQALSDEIVGATGSTLVSLIGNIAILYRPNPELKRLVLPT
ncbi:MAG: ribosome assembly RNA-binding protein YhbY [Chloroflexales bacterium]|nr:ribosome assembly RNA-binding protein YhbY [Chloroflexales bacterium]